MFIAHVQNQAIVKSKTLLRTKVSWPTIDRHETLITSFVQLIDNMHGTTRKQSKRWSQWEHSRFPEVQVNRSTSAEVMIEKLQKLFWM